LRTSVFNRSELNIMGGMEGRILIVDDDGVRTVLRRILGSAGYAVQEAGDAFQALDLLDAQPPDAALLDLKMPGMDGLGLIANLRHRGLEIPIVVLTGHGDEFTSQQVLDAGAAAYLTKPPDRADLLLAVRGAVAQGRVARELGASEEPPPLLGGSAAIGTLREQIARAAPSHATVLIQGESGTGKELVSRRLHHLSERARRPFVRVNCAAIPSELIESELFGHEKGSFTGAHRRQVGKFVQADSGTIFLDEVGDMSLKTQATVLRVLQDGEVEPVGAGRPFRSTCGWWRPPTRTCRRRSGRTPSARTSTTGSRWSCW
jgi:two-component system nitrogen regulation response regulator NtrX